MPVFNSAGQLIEEIKIPKRKQALLDKLMALEYPKDEKMIFRLSPKHFRAWLYLQSPKDALLLCSTFGISTRVRRQMSYKRWSLFTDWLWRAFN